MLPYGRISHLIPLITPSTELGHREPMTINTLASSFSSAPPLASLSPPHSLYDLCFCYSD
jgi:hypothetical protein